jgi:lipoprotein signal peptidase
MKVLRAVASLLGMTAAALCWVIGFRLSPSQSFISTTLALLIGLGAVGLLYDRYWRRSWVLELLGLPLGFYFNVTSPYFPLPSVILAGSLLLTAAAAVAGRVAPLRQNADEVEGSERNKD